MSKKKNKFDLTSLIKDGIIKDGQTLFFVSDPAMKCTVVRQISGDPLDNRERLTVGAAGDCAGSLRLPQVADCDDSTDL